MGNLLTLPLMQRIESGRLRGRRLSPLPKGVEGLRPTAARVRGAIFDRLMAEVEGARVLDLFAGSGALSFEALSRGATHATMIEVDPRVVRHLKAQAESLGVANQIRVVLGDAAAWLGRTPEAPPFDLVLIDPPFATPGVIDGLVAALPRGWVVPDAIAVCERERIRGQSTPVTWPECWALDVTKVYGQAEVEFRRYVPPGV